MWLLGLVALLALAGSQKSEPPPPPRQKDFDIKISRRAAEVIPGGRKAQAVLDMAKDARGGKRSGSGGGSGSGPNNPRQVGRR